MNLNKALTIKINEDFTLNNLIDILVDFWQKHKLFFAFDWPIDHYSDIINSRYAFNVKEFISSIDTSKSIKLTNKQVSELKEQTNGKKDGKT